MAIANVTSINSQPLKPAMSFKGDVATEEKTIQPKEGMTQNEKIGWGVGGAAAIAATIWGIVAATKGKAKVSPEVKQKGEEALNKVRIEFLEREAKRFSETIKVSEGLSKSENAFIKVRNEILQTTNFKKAAGKENVYEAIAADGGKLVKTIEDKGDSLQKLSKNDELEFVYNIVNDEKGNSTSFTNFVKETVKKEGDNEVIERAIMDMPQSGYNKSVGKYGSTERILNADGQTEMYLKSGDEVVGKVVYNDDKIIEQSKFVKAAIDADGNFSYELTTGLK